MDSSLKLSGMKSILGPHSHDKMISLFQNNGQTITRFTAVPDSGHGFQ